jgi:hypothetical protein
MRNQGTLPQNGPLATKRRRPYIVARVDADKRISIRICQNCWTNGLKFIRKELFECLPVWQQKQWLENGLVVSGCYVGWLD